jgi:hypothetical protein
MTEPLMVLPASALTRTRLPRQKGHAAPPGTGPDGETCGTCQAYTTVQGGRRTFGKCYLARERWTGGSGSDIAKKHPACRMWEPKP